MTKAGPLLFSRLRRGLGRWPAAAGWLEAALLAVLFAALAVPIAGAAGLIGTDWGLSPVELLPLAGRVLLVPALLEETLFRLLPNPHRAEEPSKAHVWATAVGSVTVYVLVHPLVALLTGINTRTFNDPAFLLLVALLGATCLITYRRTGSLWPAVALHGLVVTGWIGLGGSGPLSGG